MGKINILDTLTANQIAAGEVIERPASVIKELIENSIDAGATKIEAHLAHGGRQKIQVVDDGEGMDRQDALLALKRHATSKIRNFSDLQTIASLGFRGEALPSIAAVSRVILQTARETGAPGVKITAEGGEVISVEEVGVPRGSSFLVEDLFYNTPARLKFLKTIPSEISKVKEVVTGLALGHPRISFSLTHQNMELLTTFATDDLFQTLNQIFPSSFCEELMWVEGTYGPLKLNGFIGRPTVARSNRGQQYFFMNKRIFRSRLISSAAEKAYGTLLPVARFPFLLLNITLPAELIDVNIHPTKLEIKFREEKEVYRGIFHLLRDQLQRKLIGASWTPKIQSLLDRRIARSCVSAIKEEAPIWSGAPDEQVIPVNMSPSSTERWLIPEIKEDPSSAGQIPSETKTDPSLAERLVSESKTFPQIVNRDFLQLFQTYLLFEEDDGLLIIDQHAAHERVYYQRLQEQMSRPAQYFLQPITIELSSELLNTAIEHRQLLLELGFDFEEFGSETILLRSGPRGSSCDACEDLFVDLLSEWEKTGDTARSDREKALMIMACRQAVKAGDALTFEEARSLLADLWKTSVPQTCPHGRPTMISFKKEEIEKMFKRR